MVFTGLAKSVLDDALKTLQALFSTIPTFWGNIELGNVIQLHLDCRESGSSLDNVAAFVKTVAKKAPASVLLPTLFDAWASNTGNYEGVCVILDTLVCCRIDADE